MIVFADPLGVSASFGAPGDPQSGYTCCGDPGFDAPGIYGAWAPENRPQVLPEGVAYTMPAAGRAVIQVHYHPDGTLQQDRTRIGIHFKDEPNVKELIWLPLVNTQFVIPAGAENYEVTAEFPVPFDATLHSVLPHMHLLGRQIQLDLASPSGGTETLILIDDWDFEWQDTYWFKQPRKTTRDLRQLGEQSAEPEPPAEAGRMGSAHDR